MSAQSSSPKSVCIIPARGGSKRIPGKNIREFCGRPMIAWSIEAAQESGLFEMIVVSTDSREIADVAEAAGASVPFFRDTELASDKAGLHSVLHDALTQLDAQGHRFDYICSLAATAPMVEIADLRAGLEELRTAGAQMSLAVTTFPYCIFRGLKRDERGRAVMLWPENLTRHSQEFPEAFHDAGQFYWFNVSKFSHDPKVFFSDAVPIFLPRHRVQDIDTLEDWEDAERIFLKLQSQRSAP